MIVPTILISLVFIGFVAGKVDDDVLGLPHGRVELNLQHLSLASSSSKRFLIISASIP